MKIWNIEGENPNDYYAKKKERLLCILTIMIQTKSISYIAGRKTSDQFTFNTTRLKYIQIPNSGVFFDSGKDASGHPSGLALQRSGSSCKSKER